MRRSATPIKDIAKSIIKDLSRKRLLKEKRIKRVWENAAGKKFCPHTQPASFRKNRLVVNVDSSAWLYELTMRKKTIASKLKRALKDDFKELQFRIGSIER